MARASEADSLIEVHAAKNASFKIFLVVIPKEELAVGILPILLLV